MSQLSRNTTDFAHAADLRSVPATHTVVEPRSRHGGLRASAKLGFQKSTPTNGADRRGKLLSFVKEREDVLFRIRGRGEQQPDVAPVHQVPATVRIGLAARHGLVFEPAKPLE